MTRIAPEILPIMPMVYVAWADGVLTPEEAGAIHGVALQLGASPDALAPWLDPNAPPSPADLRGLGRDLRRAAKDLPPAATLADLGLALAALADPSRTDETRAQAVRGLGEQLYLHTPDALAEFDDRPPKPCFGAIEEATLDPAPWTAWLNSSGAEDRAAMLELLTQPGFDRPLAPSIEQQRALTLRWTQRVAEAGFGMRAFPATDPAGHLSRFVAAFETMALFDGSLTIKAGVQFGLFGGSIFALGTQQHHEEYLGRAATMELPGCFAMTERGHGSNVRDLETTATYDPAGDEIIVNTPHDGARKEWIGNAARDGQMATVFAQLIVDGENHGVHAVLVPIRTAAGVVVPRIRIVDCGPKMGLDGVDNGQLWFDNVRVPRANLLNRFGAIDDEGQYSSPIANPGKRFFTMLGTLVGGRVSLTGASGSFAKSALAIAVRYATRRRQFGPKTGTEIAIMDYPSHQRRLIPRLAKTYALVAAQQVLTKQYGEMDEKSSRQVEALAAGLKAYATWHATDTVQACREACGGQGYASRNRFADLKADCDVFTTFEGDNTVLMQLVARACLTDFQSQFADSRFFGVVRHLMGRATAAAYDRNPFITRWTDKDHLRDGQYHVELLAAREADLTNSAAGRLRKRISGGMDPFQAFGECQNHLLSLANARVEHEVLRAFQDTLPGFEGEHRRVMEILADLYGLHCIENDRGWFMENGYLDGGKARAVRDMVDALCLKARPHVVSLVDAFGIPDAILGAPIALEVD